MVTDAAARSIRDARAMTGGYPISEGPENPAISANIWAPRNLKQRPPEEDYPLGVPVDATGRVTHTIEGVPIGPGDVVAGRVRSGNAPDAALSPQDFDDAGARLTGSNTQIVPRAQIPNRPLGLYRRSTGERFVAQELDLADLERVLEHETGHLFGHVRFRKRRLIHDALIDRASADPRIMDELRFVYNDLNNPYLAQMRGHLGDPDWLPANYNMGGWRKPARRTVGDLVSHFGPENHGYVGDYVNHELTAEAFRAYGSNPNYFKTVAPNAAKAIREIWNKNPVASKILKFNAVAGAGAPLAAGQFTDSSGEDNSDAPVVWGSLSGGGQQ
jgi:hypothetical protein